VVLVGEGVRVLVRRAPPAAPARALLAAGLVLLPVAVLPDLAFGVRHRIEPAHYPSAYAAARAELADRPGDVLVLPLSTYRAPTWNHDALVLDPLGRYLTPDYVASDVLVVDGVPLSGEDPRVAEAAAALGEPTPQGRAEALGALGIGAVVTDLTAPGDPPPEVAGATLRQGPDLRVLVLPDVEERRVPRAWVVTMALAWAAFLALPLVAAVWAAVGAVAARRRRPGERAPRQVTGE
jgi:hypothetical protein